MHMTCTRLDDDAVLALVQRLDGWRRSADGAWLERQWELGDFDDAVAFMNQVFDVARELDHHPNLSNVYNRVSIRLQTHDAGGITERDATFAARVDALAP